MPLVACVWSLAERAIQCLDVRDISLTTVQACILLGTLCYVDGKGEAESLYFAISLRLALILDLPRRPCNTALERQSHLRGTTHHLTVVLKRILRN